MLDPNVQTWFTMVLGCAPTLGNWKLSMVIGVITYLGGFITMVITPAAHPSKG